MSSRRHILKCCPVCGSARQSYLFSITGHRVVQCQDCRLIFQNPQPSDEELATIYHPGYFIGSESEDARAATEAVKRATAREYLAQIKHYRGKHGGRLLEIGCGCGELLAEAEALGYEVTGFEYSDSAVAAAKKALRSGRVIQGEFTAAAEMEIHFDVCVVADVIEHVRNPAALLKAVHAALCADGVLFIATPSVDSWSARALRQRWPEWKVEHLTYFDRQNIQTLLLKSAFQNIVVQSGWKTLTADYILRHFGRYSSPGFSRAVRVCGKLLPDSMRAYPFRIVASGIQVFAQKAASKPTRMLSVIVPAFNEDSTVSQSIERVLEKDLTPLDLELIVVESNSTDRTREKVLQLASDPRVKIILEDAPRGKGHAVRRGLSKAKGDFILIQDADLEYDVEDYDAVLEPLISGRHAFVLGARHGGRNVWKMRRFAGQHGLSLFMNFGHWFFTSLVNLLFNQKLRDPFTMYKVFRRDCLYGLRFQCNRFDFDYELLIKLIRKGYRPVEIPVNYTSRSFQEGKKVRMILDPLTWFVAIVRLRLENIDPLSQGSPAFEEKEERNA